MLLYQSYKKAEAAQEAFNLSVPQTLSKSAGNVDKGAVVAQHRPRFTPTS